MEFVLSGFEGCCGLCECGFELCDVGFGGAEGVKVGIEILEFGFKMAEGAGRGLFGGSVGLLFEC